MAEFKKAFNHTLKFESGYSNHPLDRGGKTKYGITKKMAEANGYYSDMQYLSLDRAMEIYYNEFWYPLKLQEIQSQKVANELFDTGVNMGKGIAAKFLQQACNLLTNANLKVDKIIGKKTLGIANAIEEKLLLKVLNGLQFERYRWIVMIRPSQKVFFKGWIKRI